MEVALRGADRARAFTRLAAAFRRAARASGFQELLLRRRSRLTLSIIAARSLNGLAIGLLVSASINLLYDLVRQAEEAAERKKKKQAPEDPSVPVFERQTTPKEVHTRVQHLTTLIGTISTLIDFFTGPLIGRFMDAVGRLPTMAVALSLSGTSRLLVASKPTLGAYFAYRVLTTITGPAFFGATGAALGDLYGRGTQEFAAATSTVQRYALLSMVTGTYLGRLIKKPRVAFVMCGALQLSGMGMLTTLAQETLPVRKKMDWSPRGLSPTAFVNVYGRSKALVALAVLAALRELPAYINIGAVYRRQRFGSYGREQESTEMILMQTGAFLSTFLRIPLMNRLGLQGTTRLHSWCDALTNLSNALAPRMELLYLNHLFVLLQCGGLSLERCLQQEAALMGVGQGELAAAEAKRCFVPSLVMPNIFTAMYTRLAETVPAAPYYLAALLSVLAAEVATPWAFSNLSPAVRESVAAKR